MGDRRECGNCGAVVKRVDDRFCAYCGTEIPKPEADKPIRVEVVGPLGDLDARLERLEAHADYQRLMQLSPSTAKPAFGLYGGVCGLLVFTAAALFMLTVVTQVAPTPMALVPLAFVGFGVYMIIKLMTRATRFSAAPLIRKPAAILDERTRVSGGGKNSSASTHYYATLQFPSGRREEYAVDGRTAGTVTKGDLGIAFLKSDVLVDFQRVDV